MGAIEVVVGLFGGSAARRMQRSRAAHDSAKPFETARGSSRQEKWLEAEWEQRLGIAERARAAAQASNRSKDEFLAMLGHELRNPLLAIRNAIVSAQLDPRRSKRALEVAWRQTEQIDRLADDILDISLTEPGRVRLKRRCIPLLEIIERAVATTGRFVAERGHTLSVSAPADPVRVDGDPLRLEQIVVNLIRNAAKCTKCGGRIDLLVERDSTEVVLRVRDNGIGISADMLPRIFDLFFHGEHTHDHEGGFGIGLSVVRSLVSLHDGRIEARSDGLGKGAEFVVHLPAAPMLAFETKPIDPGGLRELPDRHSEHPQPTNAAGMTA